MKARAGRTVVCRGYRALWLTRLALSIFLIMAFFTFGDVWRQVLLHAPAVEPMLARSWVQWAYNEFCDQKRWSHLRGETAISVLNQRTGVCGVVQGSPTVAGGTLVFVATDIGRQIRNGNSIPLYTIIDVSLVGGTTATLNRNYSEVTNAAAASTVLDAYVTMPEDFQSFIAVLDPQNKWRLRHWESIDNINRWDPGRQNTGNARVLATQEYSPVIAAQGQARYELWPYQTSARQYPVWYYKKPQNFADTDAIIGPLARRGVEVLTTGALSKCALWPGVEGRKNLYFSPQLSQTLRMEFDKALVMLSVKDDELYFESLPLVEYPIADVPWDSNWLQNHEPFVIG